MNRDALANMREKYDWGALLEEEVDENPVKQFNIWMQQAVADQLFEPNAMSLATVGENGQPSCRTVLLKDIIDEQFVFYTNYNSKKGNQILENSNAALLFWWREQERQVRIEGPIVKADWKVSNEYFKKRPSGSQVGAIASPQSKAVNNRAELELLYQEAASKYKEGVTHCPDYWGGYLVNPVLIEFWQGRPNRLHDRIEYKLTGKGIWERTRLAP